VTCGHQAGPCSKKVFDRRALFARQILRGCDRFISVGISRTGRVLIVARSDRGENQDYQRPQDDAERAKT
jgi:hypothetical protein